MIYETDERQEVIEEACDWMIERGYATGHGDTIEDLLKELEWQAGDRMMRKLMGGNDGRRRP